MKNIDGKAILAAIIVAMAGLLAYSFSELATINVAKGIEIGILFWFIIYIAICFIFGKSDK